MRKIVALLVILTLCIGLFGCTGKRQNASNYTSYVDGGLYDEARECLEDQVKKRAWGGQPYYNAKKVEVSFSSFKLIADYKWEAQGTVEIEYRGYTAQFDAIVYYNSGLDYFGWNIELENIQYD